MPHSTDNSENEPARPTDDLSRRDFFGVSAASAVTGGLLAGGISIPTQASDAATVRDEILIGEGRAKEAAAKKYRAAFLQRADSSSLPKQRTNSDDWRYADDNFYASFTKCLPQNEFAEVARKDYLRFRRVLQRGSQAGLESIALDSQAARKLANPLGAFRYEMQGLDGWATRTPPAPSFRSATTAAEMVELYWLAHTRDVAFTDYAQSEQIDAAIADINQLSAPVGPQESGSVSAATLFRGETAGDLIGPYISQFLWQPVPYGPSRIEQQYAAPVAGSDFMLDQGNWLNVQRGGAPAESAALAAPTYIFNNRTLGEYVHQDIVWQAYFNAALVLLAQGADAIDANNPYLESSNQGAFTSFGAPFLLHLLTYAGNLSLSGAWYQKWLVHRRLRPETYGGRLHHFMESGKHYEIHADLLNSAGASRAATNTGGYFLSQAYPEGSPTHPAYPAGHATIAGCCCTVLKAFFNEDHVLQDAVVADSFGTALQSWQGADLTVGNEINKLAANISLGRDAAGVHYRSDGIDGLDVGEQQALRLLADHSLTVTENFAGFRLRKFDGTEVLVRNGRVRTAKANS